jgi:phosphopantothenoylcysteine decarboxylase/phosphopantothenate--cysteine ligase
MEGAWRLSRAVGLGKPVARTVAEISRREDRAGTLLGMSSALSGRTIALCVTGSIAAYKAAEVARQCVKAGATVLPVMTASAARFVGPVTLAGISGQSVVTDMFDPTFAGEAHVALAARAELVAIVPATADMLARLAGGRADDLVTALALCAKCPVLAAPAMHPRMWEHPATRRNVDELARQGRVTLVGPVHGAVASGDIGMGRMVEPDAIAAAIEALLTPRDLIGVRIVVTAGPTLEDLDPVRFLGNRSTGKMGFAVAARAAARGAHVVLIAGPVTLATPHAVTRVDVRSAAEMKEALWHELGADLRGAEALVMAAAVADYRPSAKSATKLKRKEAAMTIDLAKNPDLLAEVGAARGEADRPVLVGFALETTNLVGSARAKLAEKKVDLVVANEASDSLGTDDNRATFVSDGREESLPTMTKSAVADALLDRVKERLG